MQASGQTLPLSVKFFSISKLRSASLRGRQRFPKVGKGVLLSSEIGGRWQVLGE